MNTMEMHSEKIWGLDSSEGYIITGGGDSLIKVWADCTSDKELEEKLEELQRYEDE